MLEVLLNSLPVYIAIALGFYLVRRKVLPKNAADTVATISFKVAGPFFVFSTLYGLKISTDQIHLVIVPLIVNVVMFGFAFLVGWLFRLKKKQVGALALCMMLFGGGAVYPFVTRNYSDAIFQNFVTADILQFLYFLLIGPVAAVFLGMKYGKGKKTNAKDVLLGIIKDPFLITMALAFILTYFKVEVPEFLLSTSKFLGDSFFFLMTLFVGMTLSFPEKKSILKVGAMYFMRVLTVTGIVILAGMVMNLDRDQMLPLYLAFYPQFSVMSVQYAKDQGLDEEFASQIVLFSMIAQLVLYPIVMAVM